MTLREDIPFADGMRSVRATVRIGADSATIVTTTPGGS
jgi:hypothetical protein